MDGTASNWDIAGKLTVADGGIAVLDVRHGGKLESSGTDIAVQSSAIGTVNVDGSESSWDDSGSIIVGLGNGGEGRLNISAGGHVTSAQAVVGLNSGSDGLAVVDGAGSTWNLTNSTLQVGSGGGGTVDVRNGGAIDAAANVIIANGSSASGDVFVTGAGSELSVGQDLFVGNSGAGTLTIDEGGSVMVTGETSIGAGDTLTLNNGSLTTTDFTKNGSLLFEGGTLEIRGGDAVFNSSFTFSGPEATTPQFRVVEGGDAAVTFSFQVGRTLGEYGSAVVSGISSDATRRSTIRGTGGGAGADLIVGADGTGDLTIEDGGLADLRDDFVIGNTATGHGTARVAGVNGAFRSTIEVNNGGSNSDVQVGVAGTGHLTIADGGLVTSSGGVTIGQSAGAIGSVTLGGTQGGFDATLDLAGEVAVGGSSAAAGGQGTLTVNEGGTVVVDGPVRVWSGGTVVLDGGTITALGSDFIVESGATFDFRAGLLTLSLANEAVFPDGLTVPGGATLDTDSDLVGPLASFPGSRIDVNGNVDLGDPANLLGVNLQGTFSVDDNNVTLHSASFAQLGALTTLAGGTINASRGIVLGAGDILDGRGTINGKVAAAVGSTISESAGGTLTLGDANAFDGFVSAGTLITQAGTIELLDRNQATLGALTSLIGDAQLVAANGLVLDFGSALTGFGEVDTPNDASKAVINNGHIAGDSSVNTITLNGFVKGVGTFAHVVFNGTFAPGLSPAAIDAGSLAFTPSSELEIELGGLQPGSSYDQINSDGTVQLDGTLDVALLGGFTPTGGDTFELLTASGGITGQFTALSLPTLSDGLAWGLAQSTSSLSLTVGIAGDYNADGLVNAADYVVWKNNNHTNKLLPNDATPGIVDQSDYQAWKANFGSIAGSGSLGEAAIPEPATFLLTVLSLAAVQVCIGRSLINVA